MHGMSDGIVSLHCDHSERIDGQLWAEYSQKSGHLTTRWQLPRDRISSELSKRRRIHDCQETCGNTTIVTHFLIWSVTYPFGTQIQLHSQWNEKVGFYNKLPQLEQEKKYSPGLFFSGSSCTTQFFHMNECMHAWFLVWICITKINSHEKISYGQIAD